MYWHLFWEQVIGYSRTIVFGCFMALWSFGLVFGTWCIAKYVMAKNVKKYMDTDAEAEISVKDRMIAALKADLKEMKELYEVRDKANRKAVEVLRNGE